MTKENCIIANIILGISIACINLLPFIVPFKVLNVTYMLICLFDIIAIFLAFALDVHYAKENNFGIRDIGTHVILPLTMPCVVIVIAYSLISLW